MIERGETTFSEAVYGAVKENKGPASISVKLRRRNLDFATHSVFTGTGELWDACVDGGRIYRAYIDSNENLYVSYLENEDEGIESWGEAVLVATGVTAVPPSLVGLDALFYAKGDYIARATSATGGTWDADTEWGEIPAGTLDYLAAGSKDTVHLALWGTDYNTNFQTVESGIPANSGIYIPHRIKGMAAAEGPADEEFGDVGQIIVVALDMPTQIATKAEGTNVNTVGLRSNGLMSFLYQRNTWSDHFFIERFDDASLYQYRKTARLSSLPNGKWVLVSYGKDGTKSTSHDSLHYYFTGNGKYWGSPELFRTSNISSGGKILVNGKYAYLITTAAVYRSYATELVTDDIPDEIVMDVTGRVSSLETSVSQGRQTAVALRNEDSWFESSLLATPGIFSMVLAWGLHGYQQQVSHEIVESCIPNKDVPAKEIVLKSRDFLALLNTHVRSAHAKIYDTQVVGGDEYNDVTETGYGGLSHTAGVLGSWYTRDGWLEARPNNANALAYKTFKIDIWNGFIQAKINPRSEDRGQPDQWIGLCWRGYDKDNYYSYEYDIVADKLKIYEVRAGVKTSLASPTSSLGWALGVERYLRVRFRYSAVICERSTDGVNWTTVFSLVTPGKAVVDDVQKVVFEEGQSGYVARGYASTDEWDYDPWGFDWDIVPVDPEINIEEEEEEEESANLPWGDGNLPPILDHTSPNMAVFSSDGYLYRCSDFDTGPIYTKKAIAVVSNYYNIDYVEIDPGSPAYLGTGNEVNAWVFCVMETPGGTYGNIKYVENIFADNPDDILVTLQHECEYQVSESGTYTMYSVGNAYRTKIQASLLRKGHAVATYYSLSGGYRTLYTIDGTNWVEVSGNNAGPILSVSHIQPDVIYSARMVSGEIKDAYPTVSLDGGAQWSDLSGFGPLALRHTTAQPFYGYDLLHVPVNNNGAESIYFFGRRERVGSLYTWMRFFRGSGGAEEEITFGGYNMGPYLQRDVATSPIDRNYLVAILYRTWRGVGDTLSGRSYFLISTDGGNSLSEIESPPSYRYGVFFSSQSKTAFFTSGTQNNLHLTADMGENFSNKTGNMSQISDSYRVVGIASKPS